jgi:hypothetical protein
MTATEFERRLSKLALRDGMTFATFNSLDAEAIVADARRTDGARRAARKEAWLKQAGGAGNAGAA